VLHQIGTLLDQTMELARLCHVSGKKNESARLHPLDQLPQPVGELRPG